MKDSDEKSHLNKHLIVVGGPTASGKTALAIDIALRFSAEIISADSRQFYQEMTIGTAKPTPTELAQVPHHFINSLSIADDYSVGDFERDALSLLDQLFKNTNTAVVAGGSGLFINALCNGLDAFPDVPDTIRRELETIELERGIEALRSELQQLDPEYYLRVDRDNPARLRRALEVCRASGLPYSSFLTQPKAERPFHIHYIQADWPRDTLYQRINQRVDNMVEEGLEAEALGLLPWRNRPALRTVGYEEWFDYFDGNYTKEEAIDKIKQHSRNYAKRQLTWFRKYGTWKTYQPEPSKKILEYLAQYLDK